MEVTITVGCFMAATRSAHFDNFAFPVRMIEGRSEAAPPWIAREDPCLRPNGFLILRRLPAGCLPEAYTHQTTITKRNLPHTMGAETRDLVPILNIGIPPRILFDFFIVYEIWPRIRPVPPQATQTYMASISVENHAALLDYIGRVGTKVAAEITDGAAETTDGDESPATRSESRKRPAADGNCEPYNMLDGKALTAIGSCACLFYNVWPTVELPLARYRSAGTHSRADRCFTCA